MKKLAHMLSYETINLDDYTRTGEGGTAVSYKHKTQDTLAKLYNPGFEADRAVEEFLTARTVYEMGVPTPKPYRLVTDGERFGGEYEFIPGKRSFARIISEEPERLEEISREFARQARLLHTQKADTTKLRSYKKAIQKFYQEKNLVPEDFKQRVLRFLEAVPDTPTLLHGDLHIGNIITDGKKTLWIDVGEFSYGVPEWDLGILWTMTHNMKQDKAEYLFHVSSETLTAHWDYFFPAYLQTSDPQVLGSYIQRFLPFYAAKVPYVFDMAYHRPFPEEGIARISPMLP